MKKHILTIIFFFSICIRINAQWEILNEGFRGRLNTIDFVNENVGWIAGENGTLLKTTDGGENWITITLNENWNIRRIDFINESVGWAVESIDWNNAIVWKSMDGGFSWLRQSSGVDFDLIYAINENNVYAVGRDTILKTTNGGTDWIDVSPNLPDRIYNSIWFENPQKGVLVGSYSYGTIERGIILKTTNGGTNWNETVVNEFNSIYDLQFLDSTIGYFLVNSDSNSFLCKTEDFFQTWTVQSLDFSGSIISYQFLDNDTAYAVTNDSSVVKSTDGGESWFNIQSFKCNLSQIYFCNLETGFLLGPDMLYQSNNAGYTWQTEKFSYPFNNVCFIDKNKGFLSYVVPGRAHWPWYKIFSTTDGGVSWNFGNLLEGNLRSIVFVNDSVGFFITNWGSGFADIYKSTNAGKDWFPVYTDLGSKFEGYDIFFLNDEIGWVGGLIRDDHPAILVTFNCGTNWELEWEGQAYGAPLYSVCSYSTSIWAVGEQGLMVKYTLLTGWKMQPSVTDLPLYKVFFSDENTGWIAGGYLNGDDFHPILLKTTDSGEMWDIKKDLKYLINDIWFVNNQHGWAVGCDPYYKGVILESTDGGENWNVIIDNLIGPLNSIFIKDNYAWAVGYNGLILRTTNSGITWVDDEKSKVYLTDFKLEQNYPNPFNPSTIISYSIPINQQTIKVKLIIYDILGGEVVILVNEKQTAGTYEVEFRPESSIKYPASGIYFYRLTAGDYVATKKMILLK